MIAEIPLRRDDVNPHTVDRSGRTPLSFLRVVEKCQVAFAEILSERNEVNLEDKRGRTPLS